MSNQKIYLGWVILMSVLTLSGCNEKDAIQNWISETSQKKVEALKASEQFPYRTPQHLKLKAYFRDLSSQALSLKENPSLVVALNEVLNASNLNEVCQKALMTREDWSEMIGHCTKNRFFLCAEEVRAYPEMVRSFRDHLKSDLRKKFDQTESCQAAIAAQS